MTFSPFLISWATIERTANSRVLPSSSSCSRFSSITIVIRVQLDADQSQSLTSCFYLVSGEFGECTRHRDFDRPTPEAIELLSLRCKAEACPPEVLSIAFPCDQTPAFEALQHARERARMNAEDVRQRARQDARIPPHQT